MKKLRILIIRPDAMGDVLFCLPLINSLKATYHNCDVTMLVQRYTKEVIDNHQNIDNVVIDWYSLGKITSFSALLDYAAFLKQLRFDMVFLAKNDFSYAFLTYKAGIPVRIGDSNQIASRLFLTHPVPQNFRDLSRHEVVHNLSLLTGFNSAASIDYRMDIGVDKTANAQIKALMKRMGWEGKDIVCIHTSYGAGNRTLTARQYAQLVDRIQTRHDCDVVLTGSKNESFFNDNIMKHCQERAFNLAGLTTIEELKALLKMAKMMIGTQTGPVHMAAALKVPVLCISPTKFVKTYRWGPWETKHRIVSSLESCFRPCNSYKCLESVCAQGIHMPHVYRELDKLMKGNSLKWDAHYEEWFKHNGAVAFYLDTDDDSIFHILYQYHRFLEKEKIVHYLVYSSRGVKASFEQYLDSEKCTSYVIGPGNVFSWIRFVITHEIVIIHRFTPISSVWKWIIRQLSAPFIYIPPQVVVIRKAVFSCKDLIQAYLSAFRS